MAEKYIRKAKDTDNKALPSEDDAPENKALRSETAAPEIITEQQPVLSAQPLVGTQNFIRIYHEKLAESTAYNFGMFYRLKDGVDIDRLRRSITAVMNSHEAFRTKLVKTGDGVRQILGQEIKEPEIVETTEENLKTITDNLVRPYELYGNLLYRCLIIRTESAAYLFFEMHHILTDGTSVQIILKEIADAYDGAQIEKDSYFGVLQERVQDLNTEGYLLDKKYYQAKMPSKERSYMPAYDFSDTGFIPGFMSCPLDVSESDVEETAERFGLTPTKFFIMCYLMALAKVTGNTKVGTAYTVHGRYSGLSKNAVGLLLYSYYVNLDIGREDTVEDIAGKMRAETEELRLHRGFDCTSFMTETNIEEIACSNILYQGREIRNFLETIKNIASELIELPDPYYKASYFCEFEIIDCVDHMNMDFYYNASRYGEGTAEKMLHAYRDVTEAVVKGKSYR